MDKIELNELQYVEEPFLKQLERLGWETIRAGESGKYDPSNTLREGFNEVILEKMPTETLALAYSLENICDGEISLAEISKKIGSPIREIKEVLDTLGKQVIFKKKYLK